MAQGQKPAFEVFVSRQYLDNGEKKTSYTQVGAAWHVTKGGISITLQALPMDGKLVMFPPREEQQ